MAIVKRTILSSQIKSAASSVLAVKGVMNAQVLSNKSKSLMGKSTSAIPKFKTKKY